MPSQPTLLHMTIAGTDVDALARFYGDVLSAELEPMEVYDSRLYRGTMAGLTVVICPTELAEVEANRSRHQLRFEVDDVANLSERAVSAGGWVHTPIEESNGTVSAVICDPDNNTVELYQRQ